VDIGKTKGSSKEVAAKVGNAVGHAIDDAATQISGKARQQAVRPATLRGYDHTVPDRTADSPLAAPGAVAVVSFIAGAMWATSGVASSPSYRWTHDGRRPGRRFIQRSRGGAMLVDSMLKESPTTVNCFASNSPKRRLDCFTK
jgi:hypothetical protein